MTPPIAMTIAGSDCSAGAGLQADLKTFSSLGVHGLTAVTCVVSETPLTVNQVHPIPPSILRDQITLLIESYPIAAIKTGMLYSKTHIESVCELLAEIKIPLIVDPVMVASTGDPLLAKDALDTVKTDLLPLASVITPNLPEAELILERPIETSSEQESAALELADQYQAACYLKGGHLELDGSHLDVFAHNDQIENFKAPHLDLPQSHGTGCTFAAAVTAGIAHGLPLSDAARNAHQFTHQALKRSSSWTSPISKRTISHLDQIQA